MPEKGSIRRELILMRDRLAPGAVRQRSARIQQRVSALPVFQQAGSVALYYPFRGEVETLELFRLALFLKKKTLFPKCLGDSMIFVEATPPFLFQPGERGVMEPEGNLPWEAINLIIVPGVAFDHQGYRLGWGRGFYDRCLARFSGAKVGLAYDFQILSELPRSPDDQPVDVVVSESRVSRREPCS